MLTPALSAPPSAPVSSGISKMSGVFPGTDQTFSSCPARCIFWNDSVWPSGKATAAEL